MDTVGIFDLAYKVDAVVATKYAALVAGAADGSVKYPTAAGESGFVGIVQQTGAADTSLILRKYGTSEAIASGLISRGDWVQIASAAGDVKTCNPAPGETVMAIGIAEKSVSSGETKVDVFICPCQITGGVYVAAAADPGVNNDAVDTATLGRSFVAGSFWINQTGPVLYVCLDASTGAADWNTVTQA